MDVSRWGLVVVGGALMVCSGCLDRLLQATMEPQAALADSLSNLGTSAAQMGSGNDAAIQDVDRILERNPDVANRAELMAMRNQMAGAKTSGGVPTSDFQTRSLSRRDSPLYRSLPRRKGDKPRMLPPGEFNRAGITQPVDPMVTAGYVPKAHTRAWITSDASPVRLR